MEGKKWRLPAKREPARARSRAGRSKGSSIGWFGADTALVDLRGDAHGEVDGGGGVSESADGNIVGAGEGVFADVLDRDAAGGFDGNFETSFTDELDGFFDVGRGHVVEEERFGAVVESELELGLVAYFDVDGLARLAALFGPGKDFFDAAAEGDVVVLDENAVGEVEAMVFSASAADRVLIEDAEARDGFAGVENCDAGSFDLST